MADVKTEMLNILLDSGGLVIGLLALLTILGISILIFVKYKDRILANAQVAVFGINPEGNILNFRILPARIDKDTTQKEIVVKDLEETLSIESKYPVMFKKKKLYFVKQSSDGKIEVVNPSIGEQLNLDPELLDYKRWYAQIVPSIYEATHKEELQKITQKAVIVFLGACIISAIIFGLSVYFGVKIDLYAFAQAQETVNSAVNTIRPYVTGNFNVTQ